MGKSCYDCEHYEGGTMRCKYFNIACSDLSRPWWHGVADARECRGFKDEDASSGSSGSSGCFLTSAYVGYKGKADDCEELTALRSFRDGYMQTVKEGPKLIEEYYSVAPEIVGRIDSSEKKDTYYAHIGNVVDKCVKLIAAEENGKALTEYKTMVEKFKKEFDI